MRELQARTPAARGGQEPRAARRSLVRLRHETRNSKRLQVMAQPFMANSCVAERGRRMVVSSQAHAHAEGRGRRCIRAIQLIPSNRSRAACLSLAIRARRLVWSAWPGARRSMAWMVTRGLRTLQASRTWRVLSLGSLGCGRESHVEIRRLELARLGVTNATWAIASSGSPWWSLAHLQQRPHVDTVRREEQSDLLNGTDRACTQHRRAASYPTPNHHQPLHLHANRLTCRVEMPCTWACAGREGRRRSSERVWRMACGGCQRLQRTQRRHLRDLARYLCHARATI